LPSSGDVSKNSRGARRIIDEDGTGRRAFKAHPETHDEDLLAILSELNAPA
jgi:hypothetical protein